MGENMVQKAWTELTDSEKIERMRQQVKRWQDRTQRLEDKVSKLFKHFHYTDGTMVSEMSEYSNDGCDRESLGGGKELF